MGSMANLPERVSSKIRKTSTCWVWTGAINGSGYGNIRWSGGTPHAHRVVYELLTGPIPEGLDLDHLCRNRACVRPDHLEPVTRDENLKRSDIATSTINARKTRCRNGHPYDEENTLIWGDGKRRCRTCKGRPRRAA